ncbi:hypothetical protein FAQ20_02305 [Morganella morganii]|nr:hypothetical protein [Morganella morganii]EGT3630616.1 hypothetical protein [Morganella morganii]EGT3634951.1 hypothetical protein [Morganella morganii]
MKITDEDIQEAILSSSEDFLFQVCDSLVFYHYGLDEMPAEEQDRLYAALYSWLKKAAGEFKQIQEG